MSKWTINYTSTKDSPRLKLEIRCGGKPFAWIRMSQFRAEGIATAYNRDGVLAKGALFSVLREIRRIKP